MPKVETNPKCKECGEYIESEKDWKSYEESKRCWHCEKETEDEY